MELAHQTCRDLKLNLKKFFLSNYIGGCQGLGEKGIGHCPVGVELSFAVMRCSGTSWTYWLRTTVNIHK